MALFKRHKENAEAPENGAASNAGEGFVPEASPADGARPRRAKRSRTKANDRDMVRIKELEDALVNDADAHLNRVRTDKD